VPPPSRIAPSFARHIVNRTCHVVPVLGFSFMQSKNGDREKFIEVAVTYRCPCRAATRLIRRGGS